MYFCRQQKLPILTKGSITGTSQRCQAIEIDHMDNISTALEGLDPIAAMQYLAAQFPGAVAFSTSFGQEDQVIADMIWRANLPIRVFTLDTGRLFQETYDLMDLTRARYKKNFEVYFPETASVEKLLAEKGPNSFYESVENRKECCNIRKVVPLNRALKGVKVWITGLRAEQSENYINTIRSSTGRTMK
jgi:phosphoadenosine phosphosulfate reductase